MSSEDGIPLINCFSVSLSYGLAPHSKPKLTGPLIILFSEEVTVIIRSAYEKRLYIGSSKIQF